MSSSNAVKNITLRLFDFDCFKKLEGIVASAHKEEDLVEFHTINRQLIKGRRHSKIEMNFPFTIHFNSGVIYSIDIQETAKKDQARLVLTTHWNDGEKSCSAEEKHTVYANTNAEKMQSFGRMIRNRVRQLTRCERMRRQIKTKRPGFEHLQDSTISFDCETRFSPEPQGVNNAYTGLVAELSKAQYPSLTFEKPSGKRIGFIFGSTEKTSSRIICTVNDSYHGEISETGEAIINPVVIPFNPAAAVEPQSPMVDSGGQTLFPEIYAKAHGEIPASRSKKPGRRRA